MTDAVKADLGSSPMYKRFSRNMLFSRALTNGARWYCPDVFGGAAVYTIDELQPDVQVSASGEPIYQDKIALPTSTPAAAAKRKPLALKDLKALYDRVVAERPGAVGDPVPKLGAWLETTGLAPGLSTRTDAVTGRNTGLTAQETLAAEDALLGLLAGPQAVAPLAQPFGDTAFNGTILVDDAPPTAAEEAQLAFAAETGADIGGNCCPPGSPRHRRIMSMFTKRTRALRELYPGTRLADDRRHQFAIEVLGDPAKGSSSSWSELDYNKISNKLELIAPDSEVTE